MKKKICLVATVEMTVRTFLLEHIKAMEDKYDISVIANTDNPNFLKAFGVTVTVIPLKIERKISILNDIKAFISLFLILHRNKFDLVHSIMPKAGLLTMVTGYLAHIPVRLHTFTGQVWFTRHGFSRVFLKNMDRIVAYFATNLLVDSNSQRDFLIEQKVVKPGKASVLAKGSICGVDTKRFFPDQEKRQMTRERFKVLEPEVLFLLMVRLTRDKGALDLARAFSIVCRDYENARLLVVGPDEENIKDEMVEILQSCGEKVDFIDYTKVPEAYIAAADILCLPSHREGFGDVIILAAASGVPAIGSRVYGITDAIEEGVTGLLFEAGNVGELASRMSQFIDQPSLRKKMGKNAYERVQRNFSREIVTSAMLDYYNSLLTAS